MSNATKKIAVCICGHLRSMESNLDSFVQNVKQDRHVDVFLHIWDKVGWQHSWHGSDRFVTDSVHNKLDKIKSVLSPKKLVIEETKTFDLKRYEQINTKFKDFALKHQNFPSMFYKIMKCNELRQQYERETNTKYDIIMRTRPDVKYITKISWDVVKPDAIYIPRVNEKAFNHEFNDQIAAATPAMMDIYADAYNHIEEYMGQCDGGGYRPEIFLKWYFGTKMKLPVKNFPMSWELVRLNGKNLRW